MLHFNNLQTPLKAIERYPKLSDQVKRFVDAGWKSAQARSLWDLWSDSTFVSVPERRALDSVEPFDEWEEFALFASHYFLLEASSDSRFECFTLDEARPTVDHKPRSEEQQIPAPEVVLQGEEGSSMNHRRFGATYEIAPGVIGCHGGLGDRSRLSTTAIYTHGSNQEHEALLPPVEFERRMCHTVTKLETGDCLLAGGRASPDRGMTDCWLLQGHKKWKRLDDLPVPLYRHSTVAIVREQANDGVLLFGGRTGSTHTSNAWLLWHLLDGWTEVQVLGKGPEPRFGATMFATGKRSGFLVSLYKHFFPLLSEI